MNIRFACPECEHPGRIDLPEPTPESLPPWHCPQCDHVLQPAAPGPDRALTSCLVCGNSELYKKKDFPHWLGMTILTAACLASIPAYFYYQITLVWAILLGSAAVDGLLYLTVGDVVVCYRCNAHFRGFADNPEHKPHELIIAERYRQERLRREQLPR